MLKKYQEIISYTIWGAITTVINIGTFQLLFFLGVNYRISNQIALILTIIVAYIVNKIFVFKSRCSNSKALLGEIIRFTVTRGFTMLIDYFGLIILSNVVLLDPQVGKFITTFIVVFINYLLGKFHVYKRH